MTDSTMDQLLDEAESSLGVMCQSYRLEQELHAETNRDYGKLLLEYRAIHKAFHDLFHLSLGVDIPNYDYRQRKAYAQLLQEGERQQ